MRSGVLALGVLMVIAGLIFFVVPTPADAIAAPGSAPPAGASTTPGAVLQQQLSLAAMIVGAILTVLGLVLPDPPQAAQTARTAPAPARRIIYDYREESNPDEKRER